MWDKYFVNQPSIVNPHFELGSFGLQVRCAPWPFPDKFKIEYSNMLYRSIFEIISAAGLPRSGLTYTSPEKALKLNESQGEGSTGWFGVTHAIPGKEFGITVSGDILQIRCDNIVLGNLVILAEKVFSKITDAWRSGDLGGVALLEQRAHTIDFTFKYIIRLGQDKVQNEIKKNYEILSEALSLDRAEAKSGGLSIKEAFPSIGVDECVRMDFSQNALKKIDGSLFTTGFKIEAPFNENNSVLSISNFLRMEDDFDFDLEAGLNWETAYASFFRDIVLKRFLENFLCSTNYSFK